MLRALLASALLAESTGLVLGRLPRASSEPRRSSAARMSGETASLTPACSWRLSLALEGAEEEVVSIGDAVGPVAPAADEPSAN